MLILNRRRGEAILLDGGVRIVVLDSDRRGARIGIAAPAEMGIQREELVTRVTEENRRAQASGDTAWATALPIRGAPVASALGRRPQPARRREA